MMAFSERWEEGGKKTKNTAQEQAQERPAPVGLGLRLTPGPGAPFEGELYRTMKQKTAKVAVADEEIKGFVASFIVYDDEEKQGGGAGAAAAVASDQLGGVVSSYLLDAEGKQRLGTTTTSSGNRDNQEALRASLTDPRTEALRRQASLERRLMKATTERDEVTERLEAALSAEPSKKVCAHDASDGAGALALGNFGAAARGFSTSIEQAAADNKRDRKRSEDRRSRNLERVKEERAKFEAAKAKARTQHVRRTLTQLMLAVEMSPAVFLVSFLMTDAL